MKISKLLLVRAKHADIYFVNYTAFCGIYFVV